VRRRAEVDRVLALTNKGWSASAIARENGIPAPTVRMWRGGRVPARASHHARAPRIASLPGDSYAYLLGLYLGDGYIAASRTRSSQLRIFCDDAYPGLILEAKYAMLDVRQGGAVHLLQIANANCTAVQSAWRHWPAVFPQHGPGPKHTRPIALTDEQLRHTHAHPQALVRGLLHSDGCRYIARQRVGDKVYAYERYAFTNRSQDIIEILFDHLNLLGIRSTRPGSGKLAIDRRTEVAKLDAFVGSKR
jgi:hypothetical protein